MKAQRILYIGFAIIVLGTVSLIIYAKSNFKNIDYDYYKKTSLYGFFSSNENNTNDYGNMDYESMYGLNDYFIDKKVNSFKDLKNLSDYILIISNKEKPILKGNGIINNCVVEKVIKGSELKENDKIKIYDLVAFWKTKGTMYIGGSTPLKTGNEYIVFLKKTVRPSIPDTYVFTSVKFAHIATSKEVGILENYEQNTLTVEDASNYNFVFSKNSDKKEIEQYKAISKKIIELGNN